jgi:hypothetical protein
MDEVDYERRIAKCEKDGMDELDCEMRIEKTDCEFRIAKRRVTISHFRNSPFAIAMPG